MKVEDARICGSCDEVYTGFVCPSCGFDQSVSLDEALKALSGPFDRVRRVVNPHPEKIREMPRSIVGAIEAAGEKLHGMESMQ